MGHIRRWVILLHGQAAVSALELVVIATAFLIVGSSFGAVVIRTGVTSSGQVEQTINDALARTGGGLELRGPVLAVTDGQRAGTIRIDVALATSGDGVDLDPTAPLGRTIVSYVDEQSAVSELSFTVSWTVGDGDSLLEEGELAAMLIDVSTVAPALTSGRQFQIEVRPDRGLFLLLRRTMPHGSHFDTIVNLN
jgi:archaellin